MTEFAFDRSVRSFDADGRLHVKFSNISKAMVCPYLGAEIPGYQSLGLQADKIYMLLRDPVELQKGAATFNNLPLLIKHVPVSAEAPRRDLIVGTTGSDVAFDAPYLRCSLSVWDAEAIAGIESKDQTELSSAYRYKPDMTPGVYEGVAYDGVMREIEGNHVALVDVGRAGPDVVVADQNPFGEKTMKHAQRLAAAKADARKALAAVFGNAIAQDADLTEFDKFLVGLLAMDEKDDDKKAQDEDESGDDYEDDPENPGKRRKKKIAEDDADPENDAKEKAKPPAMDAAAVTKIVSDAVAKAKAETKAEVEALHIARKEVASLVGEVALDSAEAVYKFALDHAQVDTNGVHPSAYRALVKMLGEKKSAPTLTAMDHATVKQVAEQFPGIARISKR